MTSPKDQRAAPYVAVMLTRRCNMTCAHCSVESSPKVRGQPSDERLVRAVDELADAGATAILLTGGEPMLRESLVLKLLRQATRAGLRTSMTTNGFWGKNLPVAREKLRALKRAGLQHFTLSYDRYHAEFQGPQPGINLLRAAEDLSVPMNVSITRVGDDSELSGIVGPFEKSQHANLRFYDVQPIGRARELDPSSLRASTTGMCNAAGIPAVTDDLRLTACNGPAYFMKSDSPLVLGSLDEVPVAELLRRHRDDPILETIRTFGPERLREELTAIPGFESFPFKQEYSGMCELCLDINSSPEAVVALRRRLSGARLTAEREARRHVIDGARGRGDLGFVSTNGVGVAKLWLTGAAAARSEKAVSSVWGRSAARVFGRADLDWQRAARYVVGCRIARAILLLLDNPELTRWAPTIFSERVRSAAMLEAKRELSQVEALRRISAAMSTLGGTGVLLKGAAMIAIERGEPTASASHASRLPARGAGDIDLVVAEEHAGGLRSRLLLDGFTGEASAPRTGPHHLAPITFRGIPVEIHTRIMPRFWKLPERAMLERSRALDGFAGLQALDDEGMLLHALIHSTAHLYSFGLRTAWDAAWLIERSPGMDWKRVGQWADSTSMPAAFSIPALIIRDELGIALPDDVLGSARAREQLRVFEKASTYRFFSSTEGAFDLNPIVKNGFFLMLESKWTDRVAHLTSLLGRHERESRRSSAGRAVAGRRERYGSRIVGDVGDSLRQWRAYRRVAKSTRDHVTRDLDSVFGE